MTALRLRQNDNTECVKTLVGVEERLEKHEHALKQAQDAVERERQACQFLREELAAAQRIAHELSEEAAAKTSELRTVKSRLAATEARTAARAPKGSASAATAAVTVPGFEASPPSHTAGASLSLSAALDVARGKLVSHNCDCDALVCLKWLLHTD